MPSTKVILHLEILEDLSLSYGIKVLQGINDDEEIVNSFVKFIKEALPCETRHLILWMGNCSAQNKNWTLFLALVAVVNSSWCWLESITLKYFKAGHTFMSADSFHHMVEHEIAKQDHVFDFQDFVDAVSNAGTVLVMSSDDFQNWEKQLSESKESKSKRPILDSVVLAQFPRNSHNMFFISSHKDGEFKSTNFMRRNFIKDIEQQKVNPKKIKYNGVKQERK